MFAVFVLSVALTIKSLRRAYLTFIPIRSECLHKFHKRSHSTTNYEQIGRNAHETAQTERGATIRGIRQLANQSKLIEHIKMII